MDDKDDQQPNEDTTAKPPRRHWNAMEPFFDFKASHWIEIALTIALLGVGASQLYVYWRQTGIIEKQANIANTQTKLMEADQRPWISLDMQSEGPLAHDSDGWNFIFKYTINNVGKSPAFAVNFSADMIPISAPQSTAPPAWGFSYSMPVKTIEAEVETICDDFHQGRTAGMGEIMFPGVPQNQHWKPHSKPIGTGFIPGFVLIACVTYKFADDSITHSTVRIFDLTKRAYGQMIDLREETIVANDLAFFPHPENGSRAN